MIQLPEGFDSIFRYIVVVSQRAEQLVNGAKPRSESRHDKSTLVAIDDVDQGKVEWRILTQEELDAQRQAIVDQLRAEVGVDEAEEVAGGAIPDVLPTGDAPVAVEAAAAWRKRASRTTSWSVCRSFSGWPAPSKTGSVR